MPSWDRRYQVGHASFTPFLSSGDVEAELLGDRIIMVDALDDATTRAITANLLLLERLDPSQEISLYVNSEGGPIDAALAVYDAMNLVSCPVATVLAISEIPPTSLWSFWPSRGRKSGKYCH